MKKSYEYIVFDLGNTLIRFDHNISANKIAKASNIDAKKVYDTFFDSGITRPFERGTLSPIEFHAKTSKYLGLDLPYHDFVDIWNDIFWEDREMCTLARELKKRYKLILLSNISALHFEHIRKKFSIIDIFDELVLSYRVGAIKPERKIFDEVVKRAGGNREGLFYIDDREDLVKEALLLGIDSTRFENIDKLRNVMKEKGILA
ncbi:MAG: HAD family phosphatase [Candidatus Omnitrophica bacterium]|nr:HAD family phosphatase [Candidatus Omnitrophota bacterium]MBU0880642.1 HAD family phosphatase [Candidatus Omnitrophota bacterium]MBU0895344.1 HAD family phosphatase [Candidatus Omnitrophota bacterium]MBU1037442.1 HAD family phosphatase [Candidatus Omnitrophota bacterium]MBU1808259.1 HAD family phosphatase [Candidatus Omnitrophota bacterium]